MQSVISRANKALGKKQSMDQKTEEQFERDKSNTTDTK